MKKITPSIFAIIVLTILSLSAQIFSKTASLSKSDFPFHLSPGNIRELENRVKPFLNYRISSLQQRHRSQGIPNTGSTRFDETDLQVLARAWNQLSPEFKRLYAQATQIPDSSMIYLSPGGNFEIYYEVKGLDSVSTEDNYMFDSLNWREKHLKPNGIPDYIDEIAWALDSTWSMEIDRFKFNRPFSYQHVSNKYRITVQQATNSDEYGYTLPLPQSATTSSGFPSYIVIRNEWKSFEAKNFGYDKDPLPAVRVTCAHEFFHAVQYAMSRNVRDNIELDDFPLSWIEGAAVAMEECAFPEVNDFVQYSNAYFSAPEKSFFVDKQEYFNSLLLIYLSTRLSSSSNVDFIRSMHFRNFAAPVKFSDNIAKTSLESGFSWPLLLNRFHTASFFTGSRKDTVLFISEAGEFDTWNYTQDTSNIKNIYKNSMGIFYYRKHTNDSDTLRVQTGFSTKPSDTNASGTLAATTILRRGDSIVTFPLSLDKNEKGSLTIPEWNNANECIVIVSNGFSDNPRTYGVDFISCPITFTAGSSTRHYPDETQAGNQYINLSTQKDLRCDLKFYTIDSTALVDAASDDGLQLINKMYTVSYPVSWSDSVDISLISIDTVRDTQLVCMWNQDAKKWVQLSSFSSRDSLPLKTTIPGRGIFGFFIPKPKSNLPDITVFPNPVHIQNGNGFVYYEGIGISQIRIYSVDGSLVLANSLLKNNSQTQSHLRYRWDLRSSSGETIAPGVYTVLIKYVNNSKTEIFRTRLLLIP